MDTTILSTATARKPTEADRSASEHQFPGMGARPQDIFCIRCGHEADFNHRKEWLSCEGPCFACNSTGHVGKVCPKHVKLVNRWWWRFRGVQRNIPGHPNTPPDLRPTGTTQRTKGSRRRTGENENPNTVSLGKRSTVPRPLEGAVLVSPGTTLSPSPADTMAGFSSTAINLPDNNVYAHPHPSVESRAQGLTEIKQIMANNRLATVIKLCSSCNDMLSSKLSKAEVEASIDNLIREVTGEK